MPTTPTTLAARLKRLIALARLALEMSRTLRRWSGRPPTDRH